MSDSELKNFVRLLDGAIVAAQKTIDEGKASNKEFYVANGVRTLLWLERIKENALISGLSNRHGSTLGLSRDFSEWAPDYLYEAGSEVDKYYLTVSEVPHK